MCKVCKHCRPLWSIECPERHERDINLDTSNQIQVLTTEHFIINSREMKNYIFSIQCLGYRLFFWLVYLCMRVQKDLNVGEQRVFIAAVYKGSQLNLSFQSRTWFRTLQGNGTCCKENNSRGSRLSSAKKYAQGSAQCLKTSSFSVFEQLMFLMLVFHLNVSKVTNLNACQCPN